MIRSNRTTTAFLFGLFVVAAVCRADDPPSKQPRLAQDLERFRALEPSERLKAIEKLTLTKSPFASVARGDLVAAIVERGAIEPAVCVDVICKVKATGKEAGPATTIKWVIEDGSPVKKGDRLVLLDDAVIRERLATAKIKAQQADAAKVQAAVGADLAQHEGEIDVRLAEIEVKFTELELKDAPAGQSKEVLQLKVERAKLHLERAHVRSKAQQVAAELEKRLRTAAADMEMQRLREVEAELKQCELTAPIDGLVMYYVPTAGRFGGPQAVVAQGESVREGQKLLRVCELKQFVVATRVHEAFVSAVRAGQPTQVRVDAFPTKVLAGKVSLVSPTASQPDFMAKDIKAYSVTIAIEEPPPGLKPYMSAEVRITTGERKGVLQMPLTAVFTTGKDRFCFAKVGQELVERQLLIGASNATSVEIKDGLKEGDEVLSNPAGLFMPSVEGTKSPAKGKEK